MRMEIVTVTPKIAEEFLGKNTHNRNLRERQVAKYARDMSAGRWRETGEPLHFGKDGTMLDGQTRCAAQVRSGVTLDHVVIWDLDSDAQNYIDIGTPRTPADAIDFMGKSHYVTQATIARTSVLIENGNTNMTVSVAEIVDFVEREPRLFDAAYTTVRMRKPFRRFPSGVVGYVWLLLDDANPSKNSEFWDTLIHGYNLHPGHPILALRNKLMSSRPAQNFNNTSVRNEMISMYVRVWNAWRKGKSMSTIVSTKNIPKVVQ